MNILKLNTKIAKIINILTFFITSLSLKFTLVAKNNENGTTITKKTILYPAYLKVGKLKNHNKKTINIDK